MAQLESGDNSWCDQGVWVAGSQTVTQGLEADYSG